MKKAVRFFTPEMGAIGVTRWFEDHEAFPKLDWSKVTALETSEQMTMDEFKTKYPLIQFPS